MTIKITDNRKPYNEVIGALDQLNKVRIEYGWLTGKPKYRKGGASVALVAGVHGMYREIGKITEANAKDTNKRLVAIVDAIMRGIDPTPLLKEIGKIHVDRLRAVVYGRLRRRTGTLGKTIKVKVVGVVRVRKIMGIKPSKKK